MEARFGSVYVGKCRWFRSTKHGAPYADTGVMAQHRSNAPLARPRIQRGLPTSGAPVSSRDVMVAPVSHSRPQLPSLSEEDDDVTCIFDPASASAQRPVVPQSHPLMMNPTPPAAFRPMRPQTIAPPAPAPTPFNRLNAVTPPPYAPYGAFVPNANDSCPPVSLQMYADQTGSVRSMAPSAPGQTITVRPPAPAASRAGWVYAIGTAAAVACAAVGFLAFRNAPNADAPKPAAAVAAPKAEAAPLPPVVVAPPKTVDPAMAAALAAPPAINIGSGPEAPQVPVAAPAPAPAPEPKVAHGGAHRSAPVVAAPAPKAAPVAVAAAPKPVSAPVAAAPKPKPEKAEKAPKNDAELTQSQKVRDAANAAIGNSL